MDLSTSYLGMRLPSPLVVGAGPLGDELDTVKRLEDSGAAAVVLHSLFEEQIVQEQMASFFNEDTHANSFAEASSYFPDADVFAVGPEAYLKHLRRVKEAVRIPVFASLNGLTPGGWLSYARLMEEAGADALELNVYHSATDSATSGAEVERQTIEMLKLVKEGLKIPVAVKLSPFYTAFAHFAQQVDAAGADGMVLFTRLHKFDFDIQELTVARTLKLSDSGDLALRLRGVALLAGRVRASIAITGGVHTATDVLKATMAGAHVTQMVSALLRNHPEHLRAVRTGIEEWMERNEWASLDDMRGNLSLDRVADPTVYSRANYMMLLQSWPRT